MGQLWKMHNAPNLVYFCLLILFFLPSKSNLTDPSSSVPNLINYLGCSFVSKSCSWENVDKWSWVMPSYSAIKLDSPAADSLLSCSSSYFLQANFSSTSSQSFMTSPQFTVGRNVACLSFGYYFMVNSNRNSSTSSLSVTLIDTGRSSQSKIWSANAGIVVDRWSLAQVQIEQTGTYKIKLFATGQQGFIAVNNFLLRNRECPTRVCDFESGNCGWTEEKSSSYGFTVTIATGTGGKLKIDHTSRSAYGHVVYLDNSIKRTIAESIARLKSPPMASLQAQCFTFWLMQSGSGVELKLYQYHINSTNNDLIWHNQNRSHLPNDEWIRVQNSLQITDQVKLVFEAKLMDATSSVQLDDIGLTPFSCDPPISCTFEQGFCGWKEETTRSRLLWTIGHGRVWDPTKLADQTSIAAFDVLYSDFTTIKNESSSMELLSEMMEAPVKGGACVEFRYRVKSFSINSDVFQLVQINANSTRTVLWSFNDTKLLNYWQIMSLYLSNEEANSLPYRLSLYAKSSHPSTYLAVRSFQYDTNPTKCGHEAKSTVPPTSPAVPTLSPSQSLACTFEQNILCNWKSPDKKFTVGSPVKSSIRQMYFPARDHTTDSQYGHMAFAYSTSSGEWKTLEAANPFGLQQICFEFYYYFFATSDSNFLLKMTFDAESDVIFYAYGANEIKWKRAIFTVTPKWNNTRFIFQSYLTNGILALDDINVRLGACTNTGTSTRCDFEQDTACVFEPFFNSFAIWKVYQAEPYFPDHTTHGSNGHYYGVQWPWNMAPNDTAKKTFFIQSKRIDGTKVRCLTFSYMLARVRPSTVLFYEIEQSAGQQIVKRWKTAGNTLGMWFTHRTTLPTLAQIDIRMGVEIFGETIDAKILLDDIYLESTNCDYPHYCDFETGDTCTLETVHIGGNEPEDAIKSYLSNLAISASLTTKYLTNYVDRVWFVYSPEQSHEVPRKFIGYDNTLGKSWGKYILLTNEPFEKSKRAIMITERYSLAELGGGDVCLSIALFKSTTQSVLEIYQGESLNESFGMKLWDFRRGNTNWETFEIVATPQKNTSVDIFFYIVGTLQDSSAYIALDDIMIKPKCDNPSNPPSQTSTHTTPDPLKSAYFECTQGSHGTKTIPIEKTCDWVADCPENEDEWYCGSCSFKNFKMCRYSIQNELGSGYSFKFRDDASVGPKNNGEYDGDTFFMLASGTTGTSKLISPIIHQTYADCVLYFKYSYFSNEVTNNLTSSDLTVSIELTDLNRRMLIWQSTFRQLEKSYWESVKLNVGRIKHPFRVIFSATNSDQTPEKYHAIDAIALRKCEPKEHSGHYCFKDTFECDNHACVESNLVCNFVDDCGDGSDEQNCDTNLMSSFEDGRGRWGASIFKGWTVTSANNFTNLRQGPTYDHTTGIGSGSFLYTNARYFGTNRTVVSELDSPPFVLNYGCSIRFFVLKNYGQVELCLQNLNSGKKQIYHISDITVSWDMHNYEFTYDPPDVYRVIITATMNAISGSFVEPYIAIDDITFSSQCVLTTSSDIIPPTFVSDDNCLTISCLSSNGTKVCLQSKQFCDFVADCADATDEKRCGDCKFDSELCGWTTLHAELSWSLMLPASRAPAFLPKQDANGKGIGGYITISGYIAYIGAVASIQSPRINGQTAATCEIQFAFMSTNGASLNVKILKGRDEETEIFTIETASSWQTFRAEIGTQKAGFFLQFDGVSTNRSGLFLDIAIDNIQLIDCNQNISHSTENSTNSTSVNCDFEHDLCGWRITGAGERSNWLRSSNPSLEPGNDHTSLTRQLSTQYGTWLTTQAKFGAETDYLITINPLKAGDTYCLSFWYYFLAVDLDSHMTLFVTNSINVSVSSKVDANNESLWTTNMPKSRNWIKQNVQISPQKNDFYLMFVAKVDIATVTGLDDIELKKGNCKANIEFCDFEVNTCDWSAKTNGWKRNADNSKAKIVDHTTGTLNGHFLEDTVQGQTVSINKSMSTMPIFHDDKDASEQFCIQFFYYMTAELVDNKMEDNASMLAIRVKYLQHAEFKITHNLTILDTFNDGLLNVWTLFRFAVVLDKNAIIQIQGLSSHPTSRLLVDDIRFNQRFCQEHGNCDFEEDMCGWSNGQTSSGEKRVLWMRIKPNSRFIQGILLKYDHTTMNSNGNYLIMPLAMASNAVSVLKSPLIRKNTRNSICFSMWYVAQAAHSNTTVVALTVRLVDITRRKTTDVHVHGTGTLQWTQFITQFRNLPSAFVIEIEANHIQRDIQSDIGLDDIRLDECGDRAVPTTSTQIPPTEKMLNCNFDNDECNWSYDQSSWKVGTFQDQKNIYAPKMDHTLQTISGKYMMFQQQGTSSSKTETTPVYKIVSTKNVTYDKDHCITLWYYEDIEASFTLDVYIVLPTFVVPVSRFSSAIENQKRWNLLKADIDYSGGYNVETIQIQIRFSTRSAQKFFIFAVDDIVVKPGKCQHKHDYVYTFTDGLEDLELEYIQPIQNGIGLVYLPSSNHSASIAPSVDHTTNTPNGQYFLFMNQRTFAPSTYIDTLTILDLPRDDTKSSSCIRFAYQISGNVTLKMFVAPINANTYYYYTKSAEILWKPKFDKTSWTIMEINKLVQYEHKVVFYMEKGYEDKTSYLALDDITVLSHQCQDLINCDFEDGRVCSYSPIGNDNKTGAQYNFALFQAPTQDLNWPGPRYDHTTKNYGSGYLYLTAYRSTNFEKLHSKIISGPRAIDPTKNYCLTVWTRITTNDLVLNLHLIRFGTHWTDSNRTLSLASISNLTQSDWTLLALTLDQNSLVNTYEVQLLIEGTIEANSTGLIAIDDILLMEGSQCQSDGLLCENGVKLTNEKICNFIKDCPSGLDELNCGNCDFESGTCGWMNMTTYDQKWLLTNANESQNADAPTMDGNLNPNGHYLLMSKPSWGVSSNAETALNYPTPSMYLKNAYKTCVMQFDYYIQTTSHFTLQVRIGRDRADWATIYTVNKHQLPGWHSCAIKPLCLRAYVHIGHRHSQFMIDIVGHLDSGINSIMAIDNIQFVNCSTPKPLEPNQQCLNKSDFKCKNNRFCVSKDDICDYVNDCGDGSDELGCSNLPIGCNFEASLSSCGIKTNVIKSQIKADIEWNLKNGRQNRDFLEPTIDNTRNDGYGQYLVLEPVESFDQQNSTADFYTSMLTSKSDQNCRMRFFYFINSELANSITSGIEIYVQYAKNFQPELEPISRISNMDLNLQEKRWNKAVTQFQSSAVPFQFVFRGHLGSNLTRIAVDDISFDQNCVTSSVVGQSPTTMPTTTPMDNTSRATDPTTIISPTITREKNDKKNSKGKIAAAITIPLFFVMVAVGGFFGYRKYQESQRNDRNIVMSMSDIQDSH